MTPTQIDLVQKTWEKVETIGPDAARLFYARLFELDPALRAMFKSDIEAQSQKLLAMIGMAVRGLRDLEGLVPLVQSLGRRHADYGVRAAHYDSVGAALLWTLARGLGKSFTDEVRSAWTAAYTLLADTMKAAAPLPA